MFNKKKCPNCKDKIKTKDSFCASCGYPLKDKEQKKEEWGMLGIDDQIQQRNPLENIFKGGFNSGILDKMLNSAINMLQKEMAQANKEMQKKPQNMNVELFVNGKKISPEKIKIMNKSEQKTTNKIRKKIETKTLKNFSKLPQEEPTTKIKRFSNSIVYEINLPGVTSIEDISITQLENSIEVRAVSKDKSYFKPLEINFPIIDYELEKEKLILELETLD